MIHQNHQSLHNFLSIGESRELELHTQNLKHGEYNVTYLGIFWAYGYQSKLGLNVIHISKRPRADLLVVKVWSVFNICDLACGPGGHYRDYFYCTLWTHLQIGPYIQLYCRDLIILHCVPGTGARFPEDHSMEFRIRLKLSPLWIKENWSNQKEILHLPRQYICLGMCKISLWSDWSKRIFKQMYFNRIGSSIELSLVGLAPGGWNSVDITAILMVLWCKDSTFCLNITSFQLFGCPSNHKRVVRSFHFYNSNCYTGKTSHL